MTLCHCVFSIGAENRPSQFAYNNLIWKILRLKSQWALIFLSHVKLRSQASRLSRGIKINLSGTEKIGCDLERSQAIALDC